MHIEAYLARRIAQRVGETLKGTGAAKHGALERDVNPLFLLVLARDQLSEHMEGWREIKASR